MPAAQPTPSASPYSPVATLTPGMRGRVTVTDAAYQPRRQAGFRGASIGPDRLGFETWLDDMAIGVGPTFCWTPTDAIPPDWPIDDAHLSDGWHFEFLRASNAANGNIGRAELAAALGVDPSSLGIWAAQGSGQAAQTRPAILSWQNALNAPQPIFAGQQVRLTMHLADVDAIYSALALGGTGLGPCDAMLYLIQQQAFATALPGTMHVLVWCGSDDLPPDWPAGDDLSQLHLQFRYAGANPINLSSVAAVPLMGAWFATGGT